MKTIKVTGSEYNRCVEYSNDCWSNSKTGKYGSGLGNAKQDPARIERVGKLAEVAVARLFGCADPDFNYIRGGDSGTDLRFMGINVDVKCALSMYGANVFRGINKRGSSTLLSEIYIFSYLKKENREYNSATINIVGYLTKEDLEKLDLCQPRKKFTTDKVNYDIRHSEMKPIEDLIKMLGITTSYNR